MHFLADIRTAVSSLRIRGAIPPLLRTSSWHDTYLSRGTILPLAFTLRRAFLAHLNRVNLSAITVREDYSS